MLYPSLFHNLPLNSICIWSCLSLVQQFQHIGIFYFCVKSVACLKWIIVQILLKYFAYNSLSVYKSLSAAIHFYIHDLSRSLKYLCYFKKSGGAEPKFDCENYGDQGITAGCKDIYHANIDCQWLDVTELDLGTYIFKMSINPQYKASIFLAYIFLIHWYMVMYLDSSTVFSKARPLIAY